MKRIVSILFLTTFSFGCQSVNKIEISNQDSSLVIGTIHKYHLEDPASRLSLEAKKSTKKVKERIQAKADYFVKAAKVYNSKRCIQNEK